MSATTVEVQGRDVALPVEVRAARLASATFAIPARAAAPLVAPTGLGLYTPLAGRALCSIAFVDYLDGDLGTYHEVAMAVLVRGLGGGRPGAYIHRLPVDGAFTLEAGRTIWGFPKTMATIDVELGQRTASCVLSEDGEHVLTLAVRRSPLPLPGREVTMDAWSFSDGILRRTPWVMRLGQVTGRPGGATLVLGERHPVALELRSLGLPRRALMTSVVGAMTARFEAAEVVTGAT